MIAFISANLPTIIGSIVVFGVFLLIVVKQIVKIKQHKGGCGCGCGCDGCPNSGICHSK